MTLMREIKDCRLYAFVDTAYLHGRSPAEVAVQLSNGGADIIQLRAKNSPLEEVRAMTLSVLPITRAAGIPLVINDYPMLAQELGAEVCHVGQEDFFDAGHRQVSELKNDAGRPLIGLSTHAPEQAQRAVAAGADYVAIGPVYPTGTKPGVRPVTLDYVRWAAAHVQVPWFAIGGINLSNLAQVLEAGAKRVCVVSAILNANDIAAECRKYLQIIH
jgi:thiamine-phosphate pyrophosphorylase